MPVKKIGGNGQSVVILKKQSDYTRVDFLTKVKAPTKNWAENKES